MTLMKDSMKAPFLPVVVPVILLALLATAVQAAPTITANPNPVVLAEGASTGNTALTWDAGTSYPDAKVWLKVEGDAEVLFVASAKGTLQAKISAGKTHAFRLYNSDHSRVLASIEVTAPFLSSSLGKIEPGDAVRAPSRTDHFIQNVRAQAGVRESGHYADIAFTTKEPVLALVTVSTTQFTHFPDMTGAGENLMPAFPPDAATLSTNELLGETKTQHSLRQVRLGPDRRYYFVIKATDAQGRIWRKEGSFSTLLGRRVKVVIEKIHIVNNQTAYPYLPPLDRLQFSCNANGGWGAPGTGYWRFPRDGTFALAAQGSWVDVNIEADVETNPNVGEAPDEMYVGVLACNPECRKEPRGEFRNRTYPDDPRPFQKDAGISSGDVPFPIWTIAKALVDTTMGGTFQPGTRTFKLVQSFDDELAGAGLKIEATGRIEVSYPQAKAGIDYDALATPAGKAGSVAVLDAFKAAVKPQARVKLPPTGAPPRPICDAAREARARNSPAAPGLEAQCRAAGELNALAARGPAIANQDPLAVELRNLQPEGPVRRGFDIGMAASEGQTAWGPGKEEILKKLNPTEQEGFKVAVSFALDRNRNAALAAVGAAIAEMDPSVAEVRIAEPDSRYWLGFDIASGIFGDPALGALGNTAKGPGSLAIRDALSALAQRGFDAAVNFHLARHY